jgi:alpha-beta hydrolase superfamily lysophospholipase
VKVIVGDRDRLVSLAAARRTAAFYNTTPTLIEGLAHHALLDTHWRRAADAALDWLEQAVP